jgi:LysM repeat protein
MDSPYLRNFILAILLLIGISLGACTRSASPPPTPAGGEEITDEKESQRATMEAVKNALNTQDALKETGEPQLSTPTPTIAAPTPSEEPTAVPTISTPEATPTPKETGGEPIEYEVKAGDWVYSIARQFGVEPEQIIALNSLQHPYTLDIGQVLLIPSEPEISEGPTSTPLAGGTEYQVLPGEWVYSIARKFGVDPWVIIEANDLQYPYTIYPGDVLYIP